MEEFKFFFQIGMIKNYARQIERFPGKAKLSRKLLTDICVGNEKIVLKIALSTCRPQNSFGTTRTRVDRPFQRLHGGSYGQHQPPFCLWLRERRHQRGCRGRNEGHSSFLDHFLRNFDFWRSRGEASWHLYVTEVRLKVLWRRHIRDGHFERFVLMGEPSTPNVAYHIIIFFRRDTSLFCQYAKV